jgi:hypothetical protein
VQPGDVVAPDPGVAAVVTVRYGASRSRRRGRLSPLIDGKGSSFSAGGESVVARVVKRARFGFASEPLGECAWTARDLHA